MAEKCNKCELPLADTGQVENGRKVLACDNAHPALGDAVAEKCETCGDNEKISVCCEDGNWMVFIDDDEATCQNGENHGFCELRPCPACKGTGEPADPQELEVCLFCKTWDANFNHSDTCPFLAHKLMLDLRRNKIITNTTQSAGDKAAVSKRIIR